MAKLSVILFLLITSILPTYVSAQIKCIQTNVNDDVTIYWSQSNDPNFTSYQIYTVQNGLLTTINSVATTSFTHLSVTQKFDYYITVTSSSNSDITNPTVSNISLTLNNPSDGTAVLQWNNPTPTATPSMNANYIIYREYPAGTWVKRDSVSFGATFYKDTIDICTGFISYQVRLPNQPCDFTSNIKGDNFIDVTSPDIPKITNISIDTASNKVVVKWNQNRQSDTQGYIIYSIDATGLASEIANLAGLSTINYIDNNADPSATTLTYSIAAYDACLTPSVPPTSQTSAKAEVHTTMNTRHTYNICDKDVKLSWTAYKGWANVSSYEIWGHKLGKPWEKFGTTNSLEFHTTGEALKQYCFTIKAISPENRESFSNLTCLTIVAPSQPAYNYLKTATVNNEKIELHHYIEVISGIKEIVFERLSPKNIFEEIGRKPLTSENITFIDSTIYTDRLSYTYRAMVIDSCGNNGAISNSAKTILLTVQTNSEEMKHYLNWSDYEQFSGSLLGYKIFRGYDGIFSPEPLVILPNSQFFYEDIVSIVDYSGKTCYKIQAFEGANLYGLNDYSNSNSVCPVLEPIIYVPNSFSPNEDTLNQIFKPIISRIELSSYTLTIFDRWEHPVFETNDPQKGWDGELNSSGKQAQTGTYVYLIRIKDGNGIEITKRGKVNIIK